MATVLNIEPGIIDQHLVSRLLSAEIVSQLSALQTELAEMARSLDALESSLGTDEVEGMNGDRPDLYLREGKNEIVKIVRVADDGGWKLAPTELPQDILFD